MSFNGLFKLSSCLFMLYFTPWLSSLTSSFHRGRLSRFFCQLFMSIKRSVYICYLLVLLLCDWIVYTMYVLCVWHMLRALIQLGIPLNWYGCRDAETQQRCKTRTQYTQNQLKIVICVSHSVLHLIPKHLIFP